MGTWGEILKELQQPENKLPNGAPDCDGLRRRYLRQLSQLTGRPAILYTTAFLSGEVGPGIGQIVLEDVAAFMETVAGLQGRELDLILTSPGGSAEATESIVSYLRARFDHIRVFVPIAAMSAATMLALGCDEIVMGRHSQLGPIDPQFAINTPDGPRSSPAQAILDQFERAKQECQDAKNIGAWMPILRGYGPGLLTQCVAQQQLAITMVREWLAKYMLRDDPQAALKADTAAKWFADNKFFLSHGRKVSLEQVLALGLKGIALETEQALQDAVLSVHHACMHTFNFTPAAKIVENNVGQAWVRLVRNILIQEAPPAAPQQPRAPEAEPRPSRTERRRQQFGRS